MRARDDEGAKLNAEFTVESDGAHLNLILESAGGRGTDGQRPRNDQYVPALTLLLRRLAARNAVLLAALVASARAARLPETERTLLPGPVELAGVADFDQLRLDITTPQGRIGLPDGAAKEGNNRKRLQLRLDVPGYGPGDADRLAADLAAQPVSGTPPLPAAAELLRSLIGEEIRTVTGHRNMVVAVHGDTARVATVESPSGERVAAGEVQKVWVPKIPSLHATCEYSWIRPPSRSRRRMRKLPSAGAT